MTVKQNHKAKRRYYTVKRENGTPTQNHAQEIEHLSSEMEQQHQEQQEQLQVQ
ncbi:MAG: hypothetical protein ACJ704_00200 [Nitrososphaeraceae archaeon]